jgi:hypothetical protein
MAKKLLGRATISADGRIFDTFKGATLDTGGVKRTPQPGANSSDGYTEELTPSKLEADVQMDGTVSIDEIKAMVGVTVQFQADTGQTYIVNGAYSAEPPVLTEGDGKCKVVFQGPEAIEVMS